MSKIRGGSPRAAIFKEGIVRIHWAIYGFIGYTYRRLVQSKSSAEGCYVMLQICFMGSDPKGDQRSSATDDFRGNETMLTIPYYIYGFNWRLVGRVRGQYRCNLIWDLTLEETPAALLGDGGQICSYSRRVASQSR